MLKNKKFYISIFIIFIMSILAIYPSKYNQIAFEGISLWAIIVLPSVFPYLILSTILTKLNVISNLSNKATFLTKKIFRTSGASLYAFIISIFSGYPVGSKVIAELYENKIIDSEEATKASVLCSTSSPAFILGAVGGTILHNNKLGLIILISHILSAIICGIIFRFYGKNNIYVNKVLPVKNQDNIINESVYNGIISILIVGGIITVAYVMINILIDFKILSPVIYLVNLIFKDTNMAKGFISGLIETTTGIKILALSESKLVYPLITASISFGGGSIILQSLYFLNKAKIKTAIFITSKIAQAIIGFIICFIICCFL